MVFNSIYLVNFFIYYLLKPKTTPVIDENIYKQLLKLGLKLQ